MGEPTPGEQSSNSPDDRDLVEAAGALVEKLRHFASTLDPVERALLSALLAPGIADAWHDGADVVGFQVDWSPNRLPEHLAEVIRSRNLRIEGW